MPATRVHANRRQALVALTVLGLVPLKSRAALRGPAARWARQALPYRVSPARADAAEVASPSTVKMAGWLGGRIGINASQRLLNVDTEPLLKGFRHKPGSHPWIGEHVGKWLHAATLAWSYTNDADLRRKLDRVAAELIGAQEGDGYLGTYLPGKRMALFEGNDWDVWSHKYCLVGLITYHRYTGHARALKACRRAADLLLATFPAQRSILAAGTHRGMAATSVLEPMVQLYRLTADKRYLAFARYLVQAWDEPKGPGIARSLLQGQPMPRVANGKAYETLANLVGLCELARVTGEPALVQAVLNAWQDVVDKRLYVTGTTSQFEYFQEDHDLRDSNLRHVGETCVTTTWIQLNLSLLQLTGEARFGDELERSFYNHLTAAQHPGGNDWCYFTALEGRKQYDAGITCCHSSGPRGLALAPQAAYLRGREHARDVLLVSTFEPSSATFMLGGQRVTVEQHSSFPCRGAATLTLHMARPARFALRMREPAWARPLVLQGATVKAGWACVEDRLWRDGDQLVLSYALDARVLSGETTHTGRAALAWGPFVLAYDEGANPELPALRKLGLVRAEVRAISPAGAATIGPAPPLVFETEVAAPASGASAARSHRARFLAFADAGATAGRYGVWLRAPGIAALVSRRSESLLANGEESRSRTGNVPGSIIDDDLNSLVNTWDNLYATEDWFAVALDDPVSAARFVFTHGRNYHDGGWFDTQAGKPRLEVQRVADGPWDTVGELGSYPATTATEANGLLAGQQFSVQLPAPIPFVAVRVIGRPSSGDRPLQSFVTCSELQAFVD